MIFCILMKASKYLIEGGKPLKGEVVVSGAKNAAMKMIAASLLTPEEVVLDNVPEIDDVLVMVEAAERFGVKITWLDNHKLRLKAEEISQFELDPTLSCRARSTIMFMGPLLSRFGQFAISEPGGCSIGKNRPINRHLAAFEKMGAAIRLESGVYRGSVRGGLKGAEIFFEKNTVMGTENAILASVLASGTSHLVNAAREPEVDDLILFLNKMGARIERTEDRAVRVEGVSSLHGTDHEVMPDRNEVVTFAVAAAATRGDVLIKNVRPADLTAFLAKLDKVGVSFEAGKDSLRIWAGADKVLNGVSIETSPHPGFMTDWQQPFCLLLTQAAGESLIHDTIYVNRFEFVKELNRMGARVDVVQPSAVGLKAVISDDDYDLEKEGEPLTVAKISGPTALAGKKVTIPDLRAGATLVIAALVAGGRSEVSGIEHVDRGYESFDQKLLGLGARISKLKA